MAADADSIQIISRKEATERGLLSYFTGKPCKHGHITPRYVLNWACRGCSDAGAIRWRVKNPDRNKESRAAWRDANKDTMSVWYKDWRSRNSELVRQHKRNAKAKRKMAPGKHTARDVEKILKLQKGRCGYCRVRLDGKFHVDHVIALANGGSNLPRNLQALCSPCNLSKGAKDPIDFSRERGLLL